MKIGIGLPSPSSIDIEFALGNFPQIISQAKKDGYEICHSYKTGVRTDSNRNSILFEFLKTDIDAILWLDVDMIYPRNIVDLLVKANKDIIGTVYYKRTEPFDPVVYIKNDRQDKPYTAIDTHDKPKEPIRVDGVGYGGLLVKRGVYEVMGEDKWSNYGANFHIPTATTHKQSHDLMFCETAQKHGFEIWVHNGCVAYHINKRPVGYQEFIDFRSKKQEEPVKNNIAVIMPCIDKELGTKTMEQLKERAGIEADFMLLMDNKRTGYVATVNDFVTKTNYKYYVYVAQDAYAGKNWLKIAYKELEKTGKGLFAFNDGKWNGKLASFGMVRSSYLKPFFFKGINGYKANYADTELTVKAKEENQLVYNPESVLIEVDYNKHGVNLDDKKLWEIRKRQYKNPEFI